MTKQDKRTSVIKRFIDYPTKAQITDIYIKKVTFVNVAEDVEAVLNMQKYDPGGDPKGCRRHGAFSRSYYN
jgi:hypothetical protein